MSNANLRELAYREQDGLEVVLLWDPRSNNVSVEVVDLRDDSHLQVSVAGRFALDAFHHPYAYSTPTASDIASATSAQVTS